MEKQILAIGCYYHNQTIILTGEKMNTNIKRTDIQYREIPVSQLPDCHFKEILTNMVIDPDKASVIVVAKSGMIGDWASYIGWPSLDQLREYHQHKTNVQYYCETLRTPSQVEAIGDKLDEEIAVQIFPEWRDKKYRV